MKISALVSSAAAAVFLSAIGASAGTFTIVNGPSFSPSNVFTNNTIDAHVDELPDMSGQVLRFTGGSDVSPNSSPAPSISVSGTYTATGTDVASAAYNFTVDLNNPTPVTLTIKGTVTGTIAGTQNFSAQITLDPGTHDYSGTFAAPFSFFVSTNGSFTATLSFDFSSTSTTTLGKHFATDIAAQPAGGLTIDIHQLDFQLSPDAAQPIPEPSSLAFLGLGFGALALTLRRRLQTSRA